MAATNRLPQRPIEWEVPTAAPYKDRFAANDPVYREALKIWRTYRWLRQIYVFETFLELFATYMQQQQIQTAADLNSFVLYGKCNLYPNAPATHQAQNTALTPTSGGFMNYANSCLGGQGIPPEVYGYPIRSNTTGLVIESQYSSTRARVIEYWWRPAAAYQVRPFVRPYPVVRPQPAPLPLPIPEKYPFVEPLPLKMPFKALPRIRTPLKESYYDYPKPEFEPVTENRPEYWRDSPAAPEPHAGQPPVIKPRIDTRPHEHEPPPPGVRESKAKAPGHYAAGLVLNAASETGDFVDAFWQALPREFRTPGAKMPQKLADIYNNMSRLDWLQGFNNAARNQVIDALYGIPSSAFNKAMYNKRGIRPHGDVRAGYMYGSKNWSLRGAQNAYYKPAIY